MAMVNIINRFAGRQLLLVLLAFGVSACAASGASAPPAAAQPAYDMNSWETMISSECRAFFDGCNNCVREPGKMAACTRKACVSYQQPRCLDAAEAAASPGAGKVVDYACDAGATFSVIYHEYVQDDQRVRLADSEIMLRDDQTHTVYRLQRERSASGEKYVDAAGFEFFGKGDEALVMQQGARLYSGCRVRR